MQPFDGLRVTRGELVMVSLSNHGFPFHILLFLFMNKISFVPAEKQS